MIVGDAANFLLGGIPGDLHDMLVMDVEPDDLLRASTRLRDMSTGVRTLHRKLSGTVASFEGGWRGDGKDVFDTELWQPLSHGLGALERECDYAADQFVTLAAQAAEAHAQKVTALNQEIQTQLWIQGVTIVVGLPEVGGVISQAVVGLATRLGGEAADSIVAGIVRAIEALVDRVRAAFGKLIGYAATSMRALLERLPAAADGVFGKSVGASRAPSVTGAGDAAAWFPNEDKLLAAAGRSDRNGFTFAGRALQKHGNRAGSAFPALGNNPATLNAAGLQMVKNILDAAGTTISTGFNTRVGEYVDIVATDGRGIRYEADGTFVGFLEPPQ